MTKVDIFSGFLGAGKTTLIKKLIKEAYAGEKLVLIENEYGEVGIDSGFMQESGIQVNEINSGCICCTLVGDFHEALHKLQEEYHPDRILIEPTGIGALSQIIDVVTGVEGVEVNSATTVADVRKCKMYLKNFGEFYRDQVKHAGAIILSRTGDVTPEKVEECVAMLRESNPDAVIITTPWDQLDGAAILGAVERTDTLAKELEEMAHEHEHHHHDHDECDDPDCECHHHHHDDDDGEDEHEHHHHHHDHDECDDPDCECHHHHHDDDDEEDEHEHHHHHHDHDECDDPNCSCHQHHHHHHHGGAPDADEVFTSWGVETPKKFTEEELKAILTALDDTEKYGMVLRAKGIVDSADGKWIHFDHVPEENDIRRGAAGVTGRLCVIGADIKTNAIKELFGV